MTEVAQELLYIRQILTSLTMEVELPKIVRCDSQGAIFLPMIALQVVELLQL